MTASTAFNVAHHLSPDEGCRYITTVLKGVTDLRPKLQLIIVVGNFERKFRDIFLFILKLVLLQVVLLKIKLSLIFLFQFLFIRIFEPLILDLVDYVLIIFLKVSHFTVRILLQIIIALIISFSIIIIDHHDSSCFIMPCGFGVSTDYLVITISGEKGFFQTSINKHE